MAKGARNMGGTIMRHNRVTGLTREGDGFIVHTEKGDVHAQMVVNAGGTAVGSASSVWGLRTNASGADCQLIMGNQGRLSQKPTVEQAIEDQANGGRFPGYFTAIEGHFTVQVGSKWSVGRICNITEDAGKGLTDALIASFLAKFPARRRPNILAMSMRSLSQLQASRTATNTTGAPVCAIVGKSGIGNIS